MGMKDKLDSWEKPVEEALKSMGKSEADRSDTKEKSDLLAGLKRQINQEQEFTVEDSVKAVVDMIERNMSELDDQMAFVQILTGLATSELAFPTAMVAQIQDGEDLQDKAMIAAEEAELDDELMEQIENAEPGGVV